jgi:hypothetical protein
MSKDVTTQLKFSHNLKNVQVTDATFWHNIYDAMWLSCLSCHIDNQNKWIEFKKHTKSFNVHL